MYIKGSNPFNRNIRTKKDDKVFFIDLRFLELYQFSFNLKKKAV